MVSPIVRPNGSIKNCPFNPQVSTDKRIVFILEKKEKNSLRRVGKTAPALHGAETEKPGQPCDPSGVQLAASISDPQPFFSLNLDPPPPRKKMSLAAL